MNYVYNTIHRGNPEAFAQKIRDTYEDACKRFYATIAPFNAIAIIVLDEAMDAIEERGLMKHEVKRIAKVIDKQKMQYRTNLLGAMSNRRDGLGKNRYMLIQNMSVELYEQIEHDLFLIGMGIKQVLDKNRICDSQFKTSIVMANTILNFACQLFDEFFKAYRERTMADFHFDFVLGRLGGLLDNFIRISRIIAPDIANVDFDSDNNCQIAFAALNHKIADGDALNTAGERAMMKDEVFKAYIEEEEKASIEATLKKKFKTRMISINKSAESLANVR